MEILFSLLLGFLSGLLYNEHIYRQARTFPKRRFLLSFWIRFLPLGILALLVAKLWGSEALLGFILSNLIARFLHTLLRGFVVVRY